MQILACYGFSLTVERFKPQPIPASLRTETEPLKRIWLAVTLNVIRVIFFYDIIFFSKIFKHFINFEEGIRIAPLETRHTEALIYSQSFYTDEEVYVKWPKNSTEDLYSERLRKIHLQKAGQMDSKTSPNVGESLVSHVKPSAGA